MRAHENQSFYKIPNELVPEIENNFKVLPKEEDFSLPYIIDGVEASGFLIRDQTSIEKNINDF